MIAYVTRKFRLTILRQSSRKSTANAPTESSVITIKSINGSVSSIVYFSILLLHLSSKWLRTKPFSYRNRLYAFWCFGANYCDMFLAIQSPFSQEYLVLSYELRLNVCICKNHQNTRLYRC